MFWVWWFLCVVMITEAILSSRSVFRFRKFFLKEVSTPQASRESSPDVAILAPVKGIDSGLRDNIQSWFAQEYPGKFKVFFVVESAEDPAVQILNEFPQAALLIAGKAGDCGQKVHNLQYAIQRIPASCEIFLFVDSDCLLKPDWMTNLVHKVLDEPQNAATGYRWFTCQKNFGSVLRAVWNSSILTLNREDGKKNFAWGGSMGITRSAFESCKVTNEWKGSISDDYSLTIAMQKNGRCVRFVPGAIARTTDCESTGKFLRWAFRQLLITRIYYPQLWLSALLFHLAWCFWILIGIFYASCFIPAFIVVQGIQGVKADLRWQCVPIGNRVNFWMIGPLIGLCNSILLFVTLFTTKVKWRGVEYSLLGKNQVKLRDAD
jgi:ceramide glucosyltransferase